MTGLGNRKKGIVKALYKKEDRQAMQILIQTADAYDQSILLGQEEATFQNFVQAIYDLENDPSIEAIDVVMNMHGQPGTLCFWEDGDAKHCTSIEKIAHVIQQIPSGNQIGPRKLRALYTDACHSLTQVPFWLEMGFKVAAGTREYDVNHTSDIRKFTSAWTKGKSFERSIHRANTFNGAEAATKFLNRIGVFKKTGDSTKIILGDPSLNISSPSVSPGVSAPLLSE
jgi:hypothetical protein